MDGKKVGGEVAEWAREQISTLGHLDDHIGGKPLYAIARSNLTLVQNLLQKCAVSGHDEYELRLALAHMASQTGWFAQDSELPALAAQHYHFGAEIARSIGNRDFAAFCLMRLGDLANNQGEYAEGLTYLDAAEREAGADSPLRSLILNFVVEAQGCAGNFRQAEFLLAEADALYENRDLDRVPPLALLDAATVLDGRCTARICPE